MTSERFQFVKNYKERINRPINYQFRRKGFIWIGEYFGEFVGKGLSTCIITEVSDNELFCPHDLIPA